MATSKSTAVKKTTSTAKPAAKKTTAATITTAKKVTAKPTAPKAAASKPAAAKKPAAKAGTTKAPAPSPEQRYKMVQDAAYFIAEKNGFVAGSLDYWIAAETEIETLLSGKKK
ncbi:MAG: DUF2934 domain-containing protein [Gammaproteobacteria bacterium]|nr:DUF2934 domain-containing protein [Gammaproteobacteria bacterium]MBU1967620.1 DUF2934 domain-containing protein [Gammaproteobacteria bacterium]